MSGAVLPPAAARWALPGGAGAPLELTAAIPAVLAELERAVARFPTWPTDPLHALAVLGEEFGELTQATLQAVYEPHKSSPREVRDEAVQVAAMALRFLASLEAYRFLPGVQHTQPSPAAPAAIMAATDQAEPHETDTDPLYPAAVVAAIEHRPSITTIQRVLKIGYNRAARLVEAMEAAHLLSPPRPGNGERAVLGPRWIAVATRLPASDDLVEALDLGALVRAYHFPQDGPGLWSYAAGGRCRAVTHWRALPGRA